MKSKNQLITHRFKSTNNTFIYISAELLKKCTLVGLATGKFFVNPSVENNSSTVNILGIWARYSG